MSLFFYRCDPFYSASPTDVHDRFFRKQTLHSVLLTMTCKLRLNFSVEGKVLVNVECFHSFVLADVHNLV